MTLSQSNTATGDGNSNQANNVNIAEKVEQKNQCDQSDSDNGLCSKLSIFLSNNDDVLSVVVEAATIANWDIP